MNCIEGGEGHLSKRSTFKVPAAQVQQHFECYNESDGYVDFYDHDVDADNYQGVLMFPLSPANRTQEII